MSGRDVWPGVAICDGKACSGDDRGGSTRGNGFDGIRLAATRTLLVSILCKKYQYASMIKGLFIEAT